MINPTNFRLLIRFSPYEDIMFLFDQLADKMFAAYYVNMSHKSYNDKSE